MHLSLVQCSSIDIRTDGLLDNEIMEAVSTSRAFLTLLSDENFRCVECTELFSCVVLISIFKVITWFHSIGEAVI